MSDELQIKKDGELDLLSLGALVHRLDTGVVPFRKATECLIHVSGGEFNVAANLADCFRLRTGIATAMVEYPIGDMIAERVRAMGVKPFYKQLSTMGSPVRTWRLFIVTEVRECGRRWSFTIDPMKQEPN